MYRIIVCPLDKILAKIIERMLNPLTKKPMANPERSTVGQIFTVKHNHTAPLIGIPHRKLFLNGTEVDNYEKIIIANTEFYAKTQGELTQSLLTHSDLNLEVPMPFTLALLQVVKTIHVLITSSFR